MFSDKYFEVVRKCCWINKKNKMVTIGSGTMAAEVKYDSFKLSSPIISKWNTIIPTIILWKEQNEPKSGFEAIIICFQFLGSNFFVNAQISSNAVQEADSGNSCYCSYQRSWHLNEANGSFFNVLSHWPRLHATVNKTRFACRLNMWYWRTTETNIQLLCSLFQTSIFTGSFYP